MPLAGTERFGIHRLGNVVNQDQEEASQKDQAEDGEEDVAADEEGVHDLDVGGRRRSLTLPREEQQRGAEQRGAQRHQRHGEPGRPFPVYFPNQSAS